MNQWGTVVLFYFWVVGTPPKAFNPKGSNSLPNRALARLGLAVCALEPVLEGRLEPPEHLKLGSKPHF